MGKFLRIGYFMLKVGSTPELGEVVKMGNGE